MAGRTEAEDQMYDVKAVMLPLHNILGWIK